jgi:hypothetical protein
MCTSNIFKDSTKEEIASLIQRSNQECPSGSADEVINWFVQLAIPLYGQIETMHELTQIKLDKLGRSDEKTSKPPMSDILIAALSYWQKVEPREAYLQRHYIE